MIRLIHTFAFQFNLNSISPLQAARPFLTRFLVLTFLLALALSAVSGLPGWRYEKRRIRGSIFGKRADALDGPLPAAVNFDSPLDDPREDFLIRQARGNVLSLLRGRRSRR